MRVVIDTNIFVSALISNKRSPFFVVKATEARFYTLIISLQLLKELERVLFYPRVKRYMNLTDNEVLRLLDDIKQVGDVVILQNSDIDPVIINDPDDDIVLATAVKGRADYIITGDKHLLDLKKYKSVPIVTATEFLKII